MLTLTSSEGTNHDQTARGKKVHAISQMRVPQETLRKKDVPGAKPCEETRDTELTAHFDQAPSDSLTGKCLCLVNLGQ